MIIEGSNVTWIVIEFYGVSTQSNKMKMSRYKFEKPANKKKTVINEFNVLQIN